MPRISGAQRGSGVQAVVFALHTLEYIAQHQGSVGVTELARAFETTKSRMYRHLQTLMTAGYLVRDPQTERYRVSARLVALGQAVSEGFEFARAARDVTRDLRDKLGHAAVLSQTEDEGIRIVLLVPSKSSVEIAVKPGSVLSFHASAQGKIALAFGDPSLSERVLAGELPMQTVYTIGDPAKLKAEIDLTRKRGWAAAPNESVIGLNALAAPAFDALGHYAGAIAIVDTIQFIPENPSVEQVRELTEAAAQISRNLGYRDSQPVYADTNARMKAAGGAAMSGRLETGIGALRLKNPVIAGPAEHLIDPDNVRRALRTGVGAVVLKSTNESKAAREQLERAEYAVFDEHWRAVPLGSGCAACRNHRHALRSRAHSVRPLAGAGGCARSRGEAGRRLRDPEHHRRRSRPRRRHGAAGRSGGPARARAQYRNALCQRSRTGRRRHRVRSCARHGDGRCGVRARCRSRSGSS